MKTNEHGDKLPLQDGDTIQRRQMYDTVMGEISIPHKVPVCWTLGGFWYRRRDGVQMSAWNGKVMTVAEFLRRKNRGTLNGGACPECARSNGPHYKGKCAH